MNKLPVYISFVLFILSSCGGGGGGGGSSPAQPSIPLPIINLTSEQYGPLDVGSEYTFAWTTSNATSCSASGDWNQTPSTSGSYSLSLSSPKNYTFTLTCSNSEGSSSTKSIFITANYLIVGGKIFHQNNSAKTVYIDQNHNRVFDTFEYSAVSDINGNYQIRSFNNIECLKNYPVAVKDSHLFSLNPLANNEQVNISAFTSLFRSFTWSGLGELNSELYNSTTPCNLMDSRENAYIKNYFSRAIELQKNLTGYSYEDIQQDPSNSSKEAISSQRLNDLENFYTSINQITNSISISFTNMLDELLSGTGFSSNDYLIRTAYDLDYSNLVIFLNETGYPDSLADTYNASTINDITLRGDIMLDIDPEGYISLRNLNGWDESFSIHLKPVFITNDNRVMRDNSNCHVNPSQYCVIDMVDSVVSDSSEAVVDTDTYYRFQKETSRGLERIEYDEYLSSNELSCDVIKNYTITNTIDFSSTDEFYTVDSYFNRINDIYTDYDGSCDSNYYYPDYKWMNSGKIYDDGSRVFLSWDNSNIDNLLNVFSIEELSEDNLPPNQIENEVIEEFMNQPDISGYKNNELTMSIEDLELIGDQIISYVNTQLGSGSFGWIEYFIGNINGGYSYLTVYGTDSFYWYVDCDMNDSKIYDVQTSAYNAQNYIFLCLYQTDDNGDFIFSRSSTYNIDNSQHAISPYIGKFALTNNSQIQPSYEKSLSIDKSGNKKNEQLLEEELQRLKKNSIQSASKINKNY